MTVGKKTFRGRRACPRGRYAGLVAVGVLGFGSAAFAQRAELERAVVIGEYDRNESQVGFAFEQAMGHALWGATWPRKNTLGERETILHTTPDQLREIQHRYYVPNNSALIVSGDVKPETVFR